jgi:hypothetical protein
MTSSDTEIEEKVILPTLSEEFHQSMFFLLKQYSKFKEQSPDIQYSMIMIMDELSRLVSNPYDMDSWVKISGCVKTAIMAIDKENSKEK